MIRGWTRRVDVRRRGGAERSPVARRARRAPGPPGRRAACAAAAFVLACVVCGAARAAFEYDGFDPAAAARGVSGPAWPVTERPACAAPPLFGTPPPAGVMFASARFGAAPELSGGSAAAWTTIGGCLAEFEALRLGLGDYRETTLRLTAARPAETGWGWAISVALETWSAGDYGAARPVAGGGVGFAPAPGLRAGVAVAGATIDAGVSFDAGSGFTVGAGYESVPGGSLGRFRAGAEMTAVRGVRFRAGFAPDTGQTSFGLAASARGIRVDVARADHPRLGASVIAGVTFARRAVPKPPAPPRGEKR